MPKTEFGVHKSIWFKVLLLRLETKKHCLKGNKLGNVIICISYQLRLNKGLFLLNFTRLPLVARTFYLRPKVRHNPKLVTNGTDSHNPICGKVGVFMLNNVSPTVSYPCNFGNRDWNLMTNLRFILLSIFEIRVY